MKIEQDTIAIKMQEELDIVAGMLKNKTYDDYCRYEDEVADLIKQYCPVCQNGIDNTTIGIFILLGNIRNYIRVKGDIKFIVRNNTK